MNRHTPKDNFRKRPQEQLFRPKTEQRIIFGVYQRKSSGDVVATKDGDFLILDIKTNIPRPIEPNSHVKAIVKPGPKGKNGVIVLRVFGPALSLKEKIANLINEARIPLEFPKEALLDAEALPDEVSIKEKKQRLDLTGLPICTIDGESAKDFDDAVFAELKGKNIEVVVAIADVSHYVKPSTALDDEAFLRGTSVYYPGHCIPMIPEKLSNGLCSLKPNVLRLAVAVSFEVGPKGGISRPKIREAIIKSKARLTYNQVQNFFDDPKSSGIDKDVQSSLLNIQEAAHILRKSRHRRGAIDFDITESVVALDDAGEPIAINPQDRVDSHKVIEDLMVVTNEIVAEFFEKKGIPGLFRVHEAPDPEKLANFFKTAHALGALDSSIKVNADKITSPKPLQNVMKHYQKSTFKETLNSLMLRAMMQARYSEENLMHFGLASSAYSHFTSPIRRYADLVVHRQLRFLLFEKNQGLQISLPALKKIADSISEKEIRATDLERKIDRVFSATFMASHVGESFEATIISCTEFGFFVRVNQYHVEGLVHIATISQSHVTFVPERMSMVVGGSNKKYMVGDAVMVKLINVNVDRGHIDFELVKNENDASKTSDFQKKRPRKRHFAKSKK